MKAEVHKITFVWAKRVVFVLRWLNSKRTNFLAFMQTFLANDSLQGPLSRSDSEKSMCTLAHMQSGMIGEWEVYERRADRDYANKPRLKCVTIGIRSPSIVLSWSPVIFHRCLEHCMIKKRLYEDIWVMLLFWFVKWLDEDLRGVLLFWFKFRKASHAQHSAAGSRIWSSRFHS